MLGRERKAKTIRFVLEDYLEKPLDELSLLNIGCSTGIIDNYLADFVSSVVSIDIDQPAIEKAKATFKKRNLSFQVDDAMRLRFDNNTFDIVVCSQIYEHVPSAEKMMGEILRVLVPGGVCYFAASNRLMWHEPHYNLPLLSVVPRIMADYYVQLTKKANGYHELHYTYWGLRKLVGAFSVKDYTKKMIGSPVKYGVDYMLPPKSMKTGIAGLVSRYFCWLSPGYIWLLEKKK